MSQRLSTLSSTTTAQNAGFPRDPVFCGTSEYQKSNRISGRAWTYIGWGLGIVSLMCWQSIGGMIFSWLFGMLWRAATESAYSLVFTSPSSVKQPVEVPIPQIDVPVKPIQQPVEIVTEPMKVMPDLVITPPPNQDNAASSTNDVPVKLIQQTVEIVTEMVNIVPDLVMPTVPAESMVKASAPTSHRVDVAPNKNDIFVNEPLTPPLTDADAFIPHVEQASAHAYQVKCQPIPDVQPKPVPQEDSPPCDTSVSPLRVFLNIVAQAAVLCGAFFTATRSFVSEMHGTTSFQSVKVAAKRISKIISVFSGLTSATRTIVDFLAPATECGKDPSIMYNMIITCSAAAFAALLIHAAVFAFMLDQADRYSLAQKADGVYIVGEIENTWTPKPLNRAIFAAIPVIAGCVFLVFGLADVLVWGVPLIANSCITAHALAKRERALVSLANASIKQWVYCRKRARYNGVIIPYSPPVLRRDGSIATDEVVPK